MSDALEALADVRGWLCDNLNDKEAGKVCGMLSAVSREINRLEDENAKLRELAGNYGDLIDSEGCDSCPYCDDNLTCYIDTTPMRDGCKLYEEMLELGIEGEWSRWAASESQTPVVL